MTDEKLTPVQRVRSRKSVSAERLHRMFEMRKKGMSYKEIGEALGVSLKTAHLYVSRYLDQLAWKTEESAREVLRLELARLDDMMLGIYQDAISGKETSIDRVLKIMERRAKLLGLDAPEKHDVLHSGEIPTTIKIVTVDSDGGSDD